MTTKLNWSAGFGRFLMFGALIGMLMVGMASGSPLIVAHRGASADAPENTLAAFRLAWEQGADAIEGDFFLTRDGEIVCTHDATTERLNKEKRKLAVESSSLEELRQLDVGSWKGDQWAGEKMPTLQEVLEVVPEQKRIFIEVKCGVEVVAALKKVVLASKLKAEQVTIISFHEEVVMEAKKAMPEVRVYWLVSFKKGKPSIAEVLSTLKRIDADGLSCGDTVVLTEAMLSAVRGQGFETHCWTVDDVERARELIAMGMESITTNRPAEMREGLGVSVEERWFKGNTHTHSLWSDGNDFPEMIADWYKKNGYNFLVLSDHNTLSRGERWMKVADVEKRRRGLGPTILGKYVQRFGADGVDLREVNGVQEVRLKTLEEVRAEFDEAGKFLMIEGEEITDKFGEHEVHTNAVNLAEEIKPQHGDSLRETMRNNLIAVREQAERLKKPIFAHLNHPNFRWSITAEDIAHVLEEEFFEVYNGHPGINHLGDRNRPGDEKIWDIVNTLRLSELAGPLLYGVATDDSHTYHGGDVKPGRGWIMVRGEKLEGDCLVGAIQAGRFYASTGVVLQSVHFDLETNVLEIEIAPGEDKITTNIMGTLRGEEGDPEKVGKVLATYQDVRVIRHQLKGDEWFVRATMTSEALHPRPSFAKQKQQAWTQPVVPKVVD